MNIKPLADRVLILPAPAEEKTIGGIIIPDTAKEKPLKGELWQLVTVRKMKRWY
jgi:chaperonin GroES